MSRKDAKGRVLRKGESQRKDGCYQYRYADINGDRQCVYSWSLVESDCTPEGKKNSSSKEIRKSISILQNRKVKVEECKPHRWQHIALFPIIEPVNNKN